MNMGATHFAFTGSTSLFCYFMWALDPSGALVQNVNSVYLRNNDDGEAGIGVARILKPGGMEADSDGTLYDYSRVELESYTTEKANPENFNAAYLLEQSAAGHTKTDEAKNRFGRTPLSEALRDNFEEAALDMIDSGANIDSTDNEKWTPQIPQGFRHSIWQLATHRPTWSSCYLTKARTRTP